MVALCSLQKNCNNFTYQVQLQQLILLISTVLIMTNHTHTHTQTCPSFLVFITVCIQVLLSGHLKTQKLLFTVTFSIWNLLSHSSFGITLLFIFTVTTQLVLHDFRSSQAWKIIIFIHPLVNCHCGVRSEAFRTSAVVFVCFWNEG